MKRITRADIAKALQDGDITLGDLQDVINGYTPERRGPKAKLIRQAKVLAVFEMLTAEEDMTNAMAKAIIMSVGRELKSDSAFDRLLSRARDNWFALPPFDPAQDENGITTRSILLVCRAGKYAGSAHGFKIRPRDWRL